MIRHNLLAEIFIVQKSGVPILGRAGTNAARTVLSTSLQGKKIQDDKLNWWEIGTVLHTDSLEMLGKRAVCAEEGHVIPAAPKESSFGCKRCDYIFTGRIG